LRQFLEEGHLSVSIVHESEAAKKARIILGLDSDSREIARLSEGGVLAISNISREDDGFHLKRVGEEVVIAGANPRGVLYGVYALEDLILEGTSVSLDLRKVPYFRKRGSGLCYTDTFFDRNRFPDFSEETAAYLSRLGINQLTDQGVGGNLCDFVRSDIFPFQKPPLAEFQRKVRAMSSICRKYGIDQYIFLNEPGLPGTTADLAQYPKDALGTVARPWGGGKGGIDTTLCVSSTIVQRYLRNLMRKFVREYPDIKGVLFYNMDVSSWICTPGLCSRCKAVCTDSPDGEFNPWETQAKLVALLADAAHEKDPRFDFRFWGSTHYHGERFDKLIHAARGYNSLLSSWTGSDRTIMLPDAAEPDPTFLLSQKVSADRGLPCYMACEFNNLEAVPRSLSFPFHVIAALKRYKQWNVRNLNEIFGVEAKHNSINALVMRAFQWDPEQDPELFLTDLSRRQFGEQAGPLVYGSWVEMRKAFDAWNDLPSGPFPLEGSQFHVKIGTAIGGLPPLILPDIVDTYDSITTTLTKVEPWLAERYQEQKSQAFLDRMNLMNVHLARAALLAKKAVVVAGDHAFVGISDFRDVNGRPTCKEYAELNFAPIAVADALCRQRCDILRAYLFLTEIKRSRAVTNTPLVSETNEQYRRLISEDIGVQAHFCELLANFAKMTPCYTRTGMTMEEIVGLMADTRSKITALQKFLGQRRAESSEREATTLR